MADRELNWDTCTEKILPCARDVKESNLQIFRMLLQLARNAPYLKQSHY